MKRIRVGFSLMILTIAIAACGGQSTPAPTATFAPTRTLPPTFTPQPATETPAATSTTAPSPTPETVGPIEAVVDVLALNLRSGPGTVHIVVGSVVEDTVISVEGRAPGDEWVKVKTPEDQIGWVAASFLTLRGALGDLPVLEITESFVVEGVVVDNTGEGIAGITLALIQESAEGPLRTEASSTEEGKFYAYLPPESFGNWAVQVVGADCESRIMNEACQMTEYFSVNNTELIALPPSGELVFLYASATVKITGIVLDANGLPADDVRVFGVRTDGAFTFGDSDGEGVFSLAASDGEWDVFTVQFDPRREGEIVTVTISGNSDPEAIELRTP